MFLSHGHLGLDVDGADELLSEIGMDPVSEVQGSCAFSQ